MSDFKMIDEKKVSAMAQHYSQVTVFFADIVIARQTAKWCIQSIQQPCRWPTECQYRIRPECVLLTVVLDPEIDTRTRTAVFGQCASVRRLVAVNVDLLNGLRLALVDPKGFEKPAQVWREVPEVVWLPDNMIQPRN